MHWRQRLQVLKIPLNIRYSFKPADEENPSDLEYALKITDKINLPGSKKSNTEVLILKVNMKLQPQVKPFDYMFELFLEGKNRDA